MQEIILRQPLKNIILVQGFGLDFKWFNPAKGVWEWFYKDTYAPLQGHPGLDYRAAIGTPVYSAHDGVCLYAAYDPVNGNMVQIWNEAQGFKTLYGHNSEFKVKQGDIVKAGQLIALSGDTGAGTGPHVHFEPKETREGGQTKYPNNGYNGGFDPSPFIKKDYLGNNLKNDMIFKKAKNDPNVYLINEEFGTKSMVIDMPTLDAFYGKIEQVDSLDQYIPRGTFVWVDRIIN